MDRDFPTNVLTRERENIRILTKEGTPRAKDSRHPHEPDHVLVLDRDNANVAVAFGTDHDQEISPEVQDGDQSKDKEAPDTNSAY